MSARDGAPAGAEGTGGQDAEKRPPARNTAATLADLQVLWGGRDRLLRVAEMAEQLAVGAWAVYRLCETGELAHVRINNSIRVRPRGLEAFIVAQLNASTPPSGDRSSQVCASSVLRVALAVHNSSRAQDG